MTVTLWAATTAKDTDFTAKLVDVAPDGRAIILADNIVRARYRDGTFQGGASSNRERRTGIRSTSTESATCSGRAIGFG